MQILAGNLLKMRFSLHKLLAIPEILQGQPLFATFWYCGHPVAARKKKNNHLKMEINGGKVNWTSLNVK